MGVSERTFYRYMAPEFNGNIKTVLMATGNLGAIDPELINWRIKQGKFIAPSGQSLHPTEVLMTQCLRSLAFSALARHIKEPYLIYFMESANDARPERPKLAIVKGGLAGGELVSNLPC